MVNFIDRAEWVDNKAFDDVQMFNKDLVDFLDPGSDGKAIQSK